MYGRWEPYIGSLLVARARQQGEDRKAGPIQPPNSVTPYAQRLVSLRERLVTMLGSHTVRALLDRAIWQAAQCHPLLNLIHHDGSGLSFEGLEESHTSWPEEEIEAAFNDLFAEILLILARLLGWWSRDNTPQIPARPAEWAYDEP